MSTPALAPMFGGYGPSADTTIALRRGLSFEGVRVTWNESPRDISGVRLVRQTRNAAQNVDDGLTIFETGARPASPSFVDLRALPERYYYYSLFVMELGQWVKPEGCDVLAWSGPPLRLDEDLQVVMSLLESVGSYAGSARVAGGGFAPGTWIRLGPEGDTRDLTRVVWSVVGDRFYFERLGHLGHATARAVYGRRLRFVNSGGKPVVERFEGSWRDDGFALGMRLVISGAAAPTTANGPRGVLEADEHLLWLDGPAFGAAELTRAARIQESPGLLVGAPVTRLQPRGPRLVRQLYGFVPPEWRADDEAVGQGAVLEAAEADDGQVVNVESPGLEWGYQRFLRVMGLMLARTASGFAALRQLVDVDDGPVAFLRGAAGLLDYSPPAGLDDVRARNLIQQRPGIVRAVGVETSLLAQVEAATAQTLRVLYGSERVIRLCELENGLAGLWSGLPTALSATGISDAARAAWSVDEFARWRLRIGSVSWRALIKTNAATTATVAAGEPALTDGGTVRTGTADAPERYYGDDIGVRFDASGQYIERLDGVNWSTKGYLVDMEIRSQGATNATNNGWFTITSLSTVKAYVTGVAALVNETAVNAIVDGGVTEQDLCDVDMGLTPDALVGQWLVPKVSDAVGQDGRARAFEIIANTVARVTVKGGVLDAVAAIGTSYRIAPTYDLVAPVGGRLDPRLSVYSVDPESAFNDRGTFAYVDSDPGLAARVDMRERVRLAVPALVAIEVRADGGGGLDDAAASPNLAVDVDLLEIAAA